MMEKQRITVAAGDGIGPELLRAVLHVFEGANVPLDYDVVEVGEQVYLKGITTGISADAWDVIRRNKVMLKAPITTPLGGGYKSINVTLRKALGLFANVRPVKAYTPYVPSNFPKLDMVIVRENEEDLYGGIEYQQTREMTQALKLISRPGSESIIRYAFEYARAYGRKTVTCMTKNNIMKITDGLFERIFQSVAKEYPDIAADHMIIDIGTARVAAKPDTLDVVVTPNLYGDIMSDVAAQVSGSVGLGGSANVGRTSAMFEAIHGSAPKWAGKDASNPSGFLQAAVMMLVHLGLADYGEKIHNAWLRTLEDGYHTRDIYREGVSVQKVGTLGFADAIIARLGQLPQQLAPVTFRSSGMTINLAAAAPVRKSFSGVDVYLDWDADGRDPHKIGQAMQAVEGSGLKLHMVTNRGVQVYPGGFPETFCTDFWSARYFATGEGVGNPQVIELLGRIQAAGFEVVKTENLYAFDGERGYSVDAGE
ncbi:MAG: NADP-dependent isocitrate dehydrogenase [Bellilinea sp.]